MISKSVEEYLKTIYILKINSNNIRVTDIASKMNCSKPSVNKTIKILKEEGLVEYEPYSEIILTKSGEKLAKKVFEAQDILYTFLTEILELESKEAEKEAKKMKSSVSDEVLNKLAKYVNKTIGLYDLECGYDINNEKCIECARRGRKNN